MANRQSLEELEELGFEEVVEKPKVKKPAPVAKPKKELAPYVVVDNTEVLAAMNRSNEQMRKAIKELASKMHARPKGMKLEIIRSSAGFMDDVHVTFEY